MSAAATGLVPWDLVLAVDGQLIRVMVMAPEFVVSYEIASFAKTGSVPVFPHWVNKGGGRYESRERHAGVPDFTITYRSGPAYRDKHGGGQWWLKARTAAAEQPFATAFDAQAWVAERYGKDDDGSEQAP